MKKIDDYCPHCNANLNGELIVEHFMSTGKTREEAIKSASMYSGWTEFGEQNRWSRRIGISDIARDRVTHHICPDCEGKL